jgi:RNA polymerase sigma-70 factor (ECF subfamily)
LEQLVNDDAQLIDNALAGNNAAFGQLVRKYQSRLFNTLLHVVGCREEAEDVVQEAFVQAFVKLDSFRHRSAFYTWLYRIAFNVSVSRRRRKRVEVSVDQHRELTGDEPRDGSDGPGEQLLREEQVRQVRRAMESLSEEHRAILVLREMEGCCYETIAGILNLPVGTVRSRLHRARLQLREQLIELLQENLAE